MGIRSRAKSRLKKLLGRQEAPARAPAPQRATPPAAPSLQVVPPPPAAEPTSKPMSVPKPTPVATPAPVAPVPAPKPVAQAAAGSDEEAKKLARQRKAILRAKRGTLKFVLDAGGQSVLGDMHDHSERRYFVAHRGFSRLMEEMTDEGLLDYNHGTGEALLTQAGRDWLESN